MRSIEVEAHNIVFYTRFDKRLLQTRPNPVINDLSVPSQQIEKEVLLLTYFCKTFIYIYYTKKNIEKIKIIIIKNESTVQPRVANNYARAAV